MTRTIAALLAAATIAGVAAPADAQTKYFARKRIVGLSKNTTPAVVYVPTYSATYSSCNNGTRSRPISSCSKSSGEPASLTDCASFPQTAGSESCITAAVCGIPELGYWTSPQNNSSSSGLGRAATATDASMACNSANPPPTGTSICIWDVKAKEVAIFYNMKRGSFPGRTDLAASACQ